MNQKLRRIYPWLAYLLFFLASYAGLPLVAMISLGVGIAFHWRFWRIALPWGGACFLFGLWWGSSE